MTMYYRKTNLFYRTKVTSCEIFTLGAWWSFLPTLSIYLPTGYMYCSNVFSSIIFMYEIAVIADTRVTLCNNEYNIKYMIMVWLSPLAKRNTVRQATGKKDLSIFLKHTALKLFGFDKFKIVQSFAGMCRDRYESRGCKICVWYD